MEHLSEELRTRPRQHVLFREPRARLFHGEQPPFEAVVHNTLEVLGVDVRCDVDHTTTSARHRPDNAAHHNRGGESRPTLPRSRGSAMTLTSLAPAPTGISS